MIKGVVICVACAILLAQSVFNDPGDLWSLVGLVFASDQQADDGTMGRRIEDRY